MGSRRTPVPTGVFVQQLYQPTISEETIEPANKPIEAEVLIIDPDWTTPYLSYLLRDELPEDRAEAERVARRSRRYVVVGGKELYRKGTSGILMRCISKDRQNPKRQADPRSFPGPPGRSSVSLQYF